MLCPLCFFEKTVFYYEDKKRQYYQCEQCHLVFVPQVFHLSHALEKLEYDKHENNVNDLHYRQFLARLVLPLLALLPKTASGLDFGCGPGPALAKMLCEQGHNVTLYDKFYADDCSVLKKKYDFVTATEVIEHFRQPAKHFEELWHCVKLGGLLGIMTKLVISKKAFSQWHYKNDPTHIAFYSTATFDWICLKWQARYKKVGENAFVFFKQ